MQSVASAIGGPQRAVHGHLHLVFLLLLAAAAGAALADDDDRRTRINDVTVTGGGTATFTISLSAATPASAVPVHAHQTLNHGVGPQAGALGASNTCGACHSVIGMSGGPARMDRRGQMGYVPRTGIGVPAAPSSNGTWTCNVSCHGNESANFTQIHSRSEHRERGISACHSQITGR